MKFQSNSIFNGTITANSVADAGTNTDKFLVLNSGGVVTYRTAAELYADLGVGSSSAAYTSTLKHQVKAGEAINKGQAVYVSSANGTNMIVTKASNTAESTSSKTIGLLETTLALNGIGNVITEGLLAGLDTTGATNAGDPVWLGTNGNLIYGLANKPYAPAHLVFIGIVTRINVSNGEIFVKVQNGFELKEIHDVDLITTTPINGHILGYDGTLWVNKTIAGWLGFTPVTNARTLTINGTAYDLSADRSWTISSMIYPGAGIAVSTGTGWGTSITDNSTNWNTAYTNRITSLTTTGSSGAATLTSNTLNIPTYTLAGLGGVATSRTLTINGTAYDLSADRSWTIDSTSASTRTIQKFTATSGQTTFTITGGYTVGMVDVYMNGVKLDNATDFTASNGTTVVLAAGALTNSIIEVYKFGSQFIPNNALRVVTSFTATAAQTTFTVNYSVGLVDVYYNGSCLAQSEYTATNGTSIILATACQVNDIVVVYAYSYSVGAYSGIGGSGTTNTIPKFTASSTIGDSAITDNGTTVTLVSRALAGVTGNFTNTTSGNTFIIGTTYAGGRNIQIGISDGSILPTAAAYINDNTGVGVYIGDNTASTKGLYVKNGGNVGIGTTTPNVKLDVSSTYASDTTTQVMFRDNTGGGLLFGGTGGAAKWLQAQDYTGAATYYALQLNPRGGMVSVGGLATSTNYKLGVTGAAFISGTNNKGVFITDGASYSSMVGLNSAIAAYNDMEIRASGTDYQLYLTTSGKVGIGTNNPTGNLTVKTATNFNFRVDNYLSATNISSVNDAASAYAMFNIDGNVVRIQGLNTGGNVCIGTTTDFGYKLNLNGQPGCNGYTAWTNWSDSRLKENVTDFDATNVLDKISKIRPVTYNYNELSGFDEATRARRISGFIAQELMEVFPDMVSTMKRDDGGEYYDTNLSNLDLYLVKAIQELSKELNDLKEIIATK